MSPAEEIRAAAEVLRELSAAARAKTMPGPGNSDEWLPWTCVREHIKAPGLSAEPTGCAYVAHPRFAHNHEEAWEEARFITEALPAPIAEWMAFAHPGLAEPFAVLLDATAAEIRRLAGDLTEAELAKYDPMAPTWMPALAVARHILGTFPLPPSY